MNAVAIFHHVNHVGYLGFEGRVSSKMGAGLQARRGRGFKQDGAEFQGRYVVKYCVSFFREIYILKRDMRLSVLRSFE